MILNSVDFKTTVKGIITGQNYIYVHLWHWIILQYFASLNRANLDYCNYNFTVVLKLTLSLNYWNNNDNVDFKTTVKLQLQDTTRLNSMKLNPFSQYSALYNNTCDGSL